MKTGANILEQSKIRRAAESGLDSVSISRMLRIEEQVVKSFMPMKKRGRPRNED